MGPIVVAALTVAAFLVGRRVGSRAPSALSDSRRHHTPGAGPAARGRVVPCAGAAVPAGARSDEQSDPAFPWCYAVAEGDSAGAIAESITGDDGRYAEVVLVNPEIARVGTPGMYLGPEEWGWAPGAVVAGSVIRLPASFDKWIAEDGTPAGDYLPWAPPSGAVRHELTPGLGDKYAPLGPAAGEAHAPFVPSPAAGPTAPAAGKTSPDAASTVGDGGGYDANADPRRDWRMGGDVFRGPGLDVFGGPIDGRPIVEREAA